MDKHLKSTSNLYMDLMSKPDIDSYLHDNDEQFENKDIAVLLQDLLKVKGMKKAELSRRAGISTVYLHQVLAGRRKPSRNRLLCICIGIGTTFEETQRLLQQAVYAQLYPKIKRDSIVIYGILHRMTVQEINDKLFAEQEETLL